MSTQSQTPEPTVTPPAPVKTIVDQVESDELDITQAIITAFNKGREFEKAEAQKTPQASKTRLRKACWICGFEYSCASCRRKAEAGNS